MSFREILSEITDYLRKEIVGEYNPRPAVKKDNRLLVVGVNHYDLGKPECQLITQFVPENITCLYFPVQESKLQLAGLPNDLNSYSPVQKKETETSLEVKLSFIPIMRANHALTADGRLFSSDNEYILRFQEYAHLLSLFKQP